MKLYKTIEKVKMAPRDYADTIRKHINWLPDVSASYGGPTTIYLYKVGADAIGDNDWIIEVQDDLTIKCWGRNEFQGQTYRGRTTKFLRKLGVPDVDVARFVEEVKAQHMPYEIYLTADIVEHYQTMQKEGICRSCMSHAADEYTATYSSKEERHIHPLEAYERSGEFYLALAKPVGSEKLYPYDARAMLWVVDDSEGRYEISRPYGTSTGTSALTDVFGSHNNSQWEGATIPKIHVDDHGFVAPYLDVGSGWRDRGDHLAVSDWGDNTNPESGVVFGGTTCDVCDRLHPDEDCSYTESYGGSSIWWNYL